MNLDELLAIGQAYKEKYGGQVDVVLGYEKGGGFGHFDIKAMSVEPLSHHWYYEGETPEGEPVAVIR